MKDILSMSKHPNMVSTYFYMDFNSLCPNKIKNKNQSYINGRHYEYS